MLRAELAGHPTLGRARELGTRFGVTELVSLAEIVATAADGAAVFDTLLAEARSLHHAELTAQRSRGQRDQRTTRSTPRPARVRVRAPHPHPAAAAPVHHLTPTAAKETALGRATTPTMPTRSTAAGKDVPDAHPHPPTDYPGDVGPAGPGHSPAPRSRTGWRRLDHESGEIPGWAIASAAACVLGLVVYTAYSNVITKWTGKIK